MPMTNSRQTDEWIAAVVAANPIHIAPNGNIVTCPVRLHFVDLEEVAKPIKGEVMDPNKPGKYGATLLFPPGSEGGVQSVIRPVVEHVAKTVFPTDYDAESGEFSGLHFPFRDQKEKKDTQGFTRGNVFTRATSKFQPQVVDTAFNPVTGSTRIYNGVWAICALNPYTFKMSLKRGVSLGINMVVLFADDTKLVSVKADPKATFSGIKIDASFNAGDAFGSGPNKVSGSAAQQFL